MQTLITPQVYKASFEDRLDLNDNYSEYHFELLEPLEMKNYPGQYISLKIDDKTRRSYSMTDRSDIDHGFELLVDHHAQGVGTTFLKNLQFGDEVEVLGPLGHFYLRQNDAPALTLVASGSGIAPLRAMLFDLFQLHQDTRPVKLYWGMRFEYDLFWLDMFTDLQNHFPNFSFIPVISKPSANWTLSTGHVCDLLRHEDLLSESDFYLCGRPEMVSEVREILTERDISPEKVYFEQF